MNNDYVFIISSSTLIFFIFLSKFLQLPQHIHYRYHTTYQYFNDKKGNSDSNSVVMRE